ncbi:MAG: hypothetical protein DMG37_17380 [Acidobacteria bacterium]|nr:MAG: hypothetical protein DMG37_17380 [Acidobacteriota bacterium]
MSRVVIAVALATLFVGVAILAHNRPAASGKADPLVFVFLRVDPARDVAILRPMIAPDIGVQLDSGPRNLKRGTVLHCTTSIREHSAIVEEQKESISELLLDCGDHKFVVKGLDFTQGAK